MSKQSVRPRTVAGLGDQVEALTGEVATLRNQLIDARRERDRSRSAARLIASLAGGSIGGYFWHQAALRDGTFSNTELFATDLGVGLACALGALIALAVFQSCQSD